MIKTGIYNLNQIKKQSNFKGLFGDDKNFSITLYEQVQQEVNSEELTERILRLFSDERGAYKRTYTKRFEEFDIKIAEYLENNFDKNCSLTIHDVGVSDGRTAVDFFEKLLIKFANLKFIGSDYNPKVYILEKGRCKVTISHTGKVLEILFPPFVFNKIKRDSYRHYPLNHVIRLMVELFIVLSLIKEYKFNKRQAKELFLFVPKALNITKNNPNFILNQHDLLQPFKKKVHVVRAMNVLNSSYFSKDEFIVVLTHIYDGLFDGGLLITGSNQEAGTIVHGGVYKKVTQGFQKVIQFGDGSSIDQLILQIKK